MLSDRHFNAKSFAASLAWAGRSDSFLLGLATLLFCLMPSCFKLQSAIAQSNFPACQPPNLGEYLLLVDTQSASSNAQLQRLLPETAEVRSCLYLDELVTRIGGFSNLDEANNWARYVIEIGGLEAYVVQPPSANSANVPGYNPQPLGSGYAVLIDYFNRPEVAAEVQQLLGKNVGLVSFGQRPFLLAVHTANQQDANSALRTLSDRGYWVMVVDGRKVVLLTSTVSF